MINAFFLGLDNEHVWRAQDSDTMCKRIYNFLTKGLLPEDTHQQKKMLKLSQHLVVNGGTLYYSPKPGELGRSRAFIPKGTLRAEIIKRLHNDVLAGHLGYDKTRQRISDLFYWPKMEQDIRNYIDGCYSCKINKAQHQSDIIVDLTECKPSGNKHLLHFIDRFTKYVELIPIIKMDAETTAKHFLERVVLKHGTPWRCSEKTWN